MYFFINFYDFLIKNFFDGFTRFFDGFTMIISDYISA